MAATRIILATLGLGGLALAFAPFMGAEVFGSHMSFGEAHGMVTVICGIAGGTLILMALALPEKRPQ